MNGGKAFLVYFKNHNIYSSPSSNVKKKPTTEPKVRTGGNCRSPTTLRTSGSWNRSIRSFPRSKQGSFPFFWVVKIFRIEVAPPIFFTHNLFNYILQEFICFYCHFKACVFKTKLALGFSNVRNILRFMLNRFFSCLSRQNVPPCGSSIKRKR